MKEIASAEMASALEGWLPSDVVIEWEAIRLPPEAANPPAELAVVAQAAGKRRAEFLSGRVAARRALARLGRPVDRLLPGDGRAPAWPEGVVGSISHGAGWCVAAVALAGSYGGLGLDLEECKPLSEDLIQRVAGPAERACLPADGPERGMAAMLLFSAKEAVFKAQYPRFRCFLGFQDVLTRLAETGGFAASLHPGALPEPGDAASREALTTALARGRGIWRLRPNFMLTGFHFPING